jgi:hypothetical protein
MTQQRFLRHVLALALALAGISAGVVGAQEGGWRVTTVMRLSEAQEGYNSRPQAVFIAPDGVQVAYEKRDEEDYSAICVLNILLKAERCVSLPRESAYGFPPSEYFPPMRWSGDSRRLALVGMPLRYFLDTDLGVIDLDRSADAFRYLADDGYSGSLFPDPPLGVSVEVNPIFSPDGARIAVEQTLTGPGGRLSLTTISIFDLENGQIRAVTELPGHEAYEVDAGAVVSMDWSPDGTTLAVALRHLDLEPDYDGIWLVDVESGEMTHLVSVAEAVAAIQTVYPGYEQILAAAPVRWSPDGTRLLFWAGDAGSRIAKIWAFWVELDTGDIRAVPLPETLHDTEELRTIWPMQAAWSPDGQTLLVAARVLAMPDANELVPLVESDEPMWTAIYLVDVESRGYALLGHLPRDIAPLFDAAWGPDNDVIAGGFYLKLSRE